MNSIYKIIGTVILSSLCLNGMAAVIPAEDCTTYFHDSTMNALDYTLQRPLPARKFENKKFGDHLFISVEGGPDWMRTKVGEIGADPGKSGFRAGFTIGDWITPVHGLRLTLDYGQHSGMDRLKPFFGSIGVDYLMNFSSLLRDYNPSRRFELVGFAGIEAEGLYRQGHDLWGAFGVRFGLQPRVYLTNSTYFYIEPRFGVYSDGLDDYKTWHKYDWNASLMFGFGYRLNAGRGYRVDNSLFIDNCFRDNLFVGFSGGLNIVDTSTADLRPRIGGAGSVFIGKWFTSASALRLSATGLELREENYPRRWAGMIDIDYMWNINSSMNGYDPDRKLGVNFLFGVSGAFRTASGNKIYPGLHVGVQGVWNVSPYVGIFIEPQLRMFSRSMSPSHSQPTTFLPALTLGVAYNFRGTEAYRKYRQTFDYNEFLNSERYFFELKGGVQMRSRQWVANYALEGGFGKWFTPESAWRVRGRYAQLNEQASRFRSVTVGGDYILSLSTLAAGFDDSRIFDLDAFAGLELGVAHYNGGKNSIIFGPELGLTGRFRVSPSVEIMLEPSVAVSRIPNYMSRNFNPEARIMAGLSYRLGRSKAEKRGNLFGLDDAFVSFTVGPNVYSETMLNDNGNMISWSADATAGYWFDDISGIQGGLSYDLINRHRATDLYVGYLHVDYMLNLTGLFTGDREKKVSISAFAGPGFGWSNRSNGNLSPVGRIGLEARVRLTDRLDFVASPNVSFWLPRLVVDGGHNNHHFAGTGSLPVGVSLRF
ncbi:MAG: hypothetical protein NC098_07850 [Lachnoclostridium sp.]|nr:hypothetical protein [Lachnoclostridium sp.]